MTYWQTAIAAAANHDKQVGNPGRNGNEQVRLLQVSGVNPLGKLLHAVI
jgi:hypothetical protein